MLSVPLSEALELPFGVERTTQKPHAEYTTCLQADVSHVSPKQICTYPHKTSTAVSFPTPNEIFQISDSQEQASINAFSILSLHPAPDPYRASAAICAVNL